MSWWLDAVCVVVAAALHAAALGLFIRTDFPEDEATR